MRFSLCRPAAVQSSCRFALRPVALVAALMGGLLAAPWGYAQTLATVEEPALVLKSSPLLAETISPAQRDNAPVFLEADRISGRPDLDTTISGNASFRKAGTSIFAEQLEYDQPTDTAKATGNVRINRGGNVYEGPRVELKVDAFEGYFDQPSYRLLQNNAHGDASRADFISETRTVIHNATYTTCKRVPGPSWMPDWVLRATSITIDNDEEVGVATDGALSFKGVTILPVPSFTFPLTNKRKSGFLPPVIGLDNVNGAEIVAPYYWNIAPNRDATITPTLMTARGVDLGAEFRYLEPGYSGTVRANVMPADSLRGTDRWGISTVHNAVVNTGLPDVGTIGVAVNLNRVSDDNYWRDFTRSASTLTQRLLPNDVNASWARGPVAISTRVLQWQTLQSVDAPIVPPYDRVPQLTARVGLNNVRGLDVSTEADYTRFEAKRMLTGQPNAQRIYSLTQLSRPWLTPSGFMTPKLQLHANAYQFDNPLSNGSMAADSVVPTFSLDSGLVFERDTTILGKSLVQTLEPRAFYVLTPYRNQSQLPNYDTGANDFNFASIYTENAFGGHDKISDNNLLTLGLTTRLIDSDTGAQLARFGVAQRLRFEDQNVTLNSSTSPALAGLSDILLGASVNVNERWALESTAQYNGRTEQSERSTIGARYKPGDYRVVNAAYRFQRNASEQVDVSWQWPLNDLLGGGPSAAGNKTALDEGRYYGVGRLNYSLNERRLVDTVLGVEYDAGCWLARFVLERVQTSTSSATQRLYFQLEFVGFTRLGVDPRKTLSQNISRYQNLRESGSNNSRFSNYD
jgi:LPS-assembly protein